MTVTALPAGTAVPRTSAVAVRLCCVGALALFGALQWATLARPSVAGPMVASVVLAAVAAGVIAQARRRLVVVAVSLALVPLGLLVAGASVGDLLPEGWGGLIAAIRDGLAALPGFRIPYAGGDEAVLLVVQAGGILLIGIAFVAAAALPRRGRLVAVGALVVLYGVPATQTSASSPYLRGAVFAVLIGAVVWGEGLARRGGAVEAPVAALVLGLGVIAGIALGPGLDSARPWVNWDRLVESISTGDTERFSWDHRYGPLDWPRDGRVVLRVKARQSAYWKATNLDGFDGLRWVHGGLRPDQGLRSLGGADVPTRPQWEQRIRVQLAGIRTDQVIGAGSTLALDRLRLTPLSVGSPGTWAVVGQLHRGDAYTARVYVPRPSPDQLARAGTAYPDVMELYRSVHLPSARRDPTRDTEMVFRPFGSHRPPIALGPTATIAEAGDRVLGASPYGRAYALARRLAAGAGTPYEFARRVEAYLNSERFRYEENVPRRAVPLDAFLFRDRLGYCQQFSGAMALLLRMGGVPARVAAGFSPGSLDPTRGEYIVRDVDAHSWVEAYFPHYGWITFDPTPAIAPARAQSAFDPSAAGRPGPAADGALGDRLSDPKGGARAVGAPDHASFPVALVVAALAGVGLLVAIALIAARRLRRPPPRPVDPRLAELERALRRSGRRPDAGMTLRRLERAFEAEPDAVGYLRALREARYGFETTQPTRVQRRGLRRALAAGWQYTGGVRALWALPPSVWRRS